ncbi:MAG: hypothetical protein M0Z83_08845 [Betaproteobacteria bacterium]|nr:hypothetical protein [Betaproteobacteria bacterium]
MLLDFVFSTIVFLFVGFAARRYFDHQGIPAGITRSLLVLVLATAASFAASALLSWILGEPDADTQLLQQAQTLQKNLSGGNPPH